MIDLIGCTAIGSILVAYFLFQTIIASKRYVYDRWGSKDEKAQFNYHDIYTAFQTPWLIKDIDYGALLCMYPEDKALKKEVRNIKRYWYLAVGFLVIFMIMCGVLKYLQS